MFAALGGQDARSQLACGMAAGLALYGPALWWMVDFSGPGFVVTVLLESAVLACSLVLLPGARAARRASTAARIAAFPAALVLAEAVRGAWPFGGLPLAGIELGQVAGPLAPVFRLGGRLLVTGLVGLGGAFLASAVVTVLALRHTVEKPGRDVPRRLLAPAAALLVLVATIWAGSIAPRGGVVGELTIASVQGGGERGFRAVDRDQAPVFEAHLRTSAEVDSPVDLVLWPEDVVDVAGSIKDTPEEAALEELASELDAPVVAGVVEGFGDRFRNAAVVFGADDGDSMTERYDKVHLVPFGEYVPARSLVGRVADLSAVPRDAVAGDGPGVVTASGTRLGVLISYEVFFEDRGRAAVRAGGTVLLVPTNASSFRGPQVPAQELAAARARALETGRWVVQAAPTGYSAVVDDLGSVVARGPLGAAVVLQEDVVLREGSTPYVTTGPWPVLALAITILMAAQILTSRRGPSGGRRWFPARRSPAPGTAGSQPP